MIGCEYKLVELREEIGDQIGRWFDIEQIKGFRRKMGWTRNYKKNPNYEEEEDITDALEDFDEE